MARRSPTERSSITRSQLLRFAGWFQLVNAGVLCLAGLRNFRFEALPSDALGQSFLALMLPGHFLVMSSLLVPLVCGSAALLPRRWVLTWAACLNTALLSLVLLDTQVFALYRSHLDGAVWALVTSGFASEILNLSPGAFVQAGLVVAGLAVAESLLASLVYRTVTRHSRMRGKTVAAFGVVIVVAGQLLHAWGDAHMLGSITRQARNLPWSRAITAHSLFEEWGWIADHDAVPSGVPDRETALHYPREPLSCAVPDPPPNLLFIVIEEWRFDELDPRTSPQLWSFSSDATVFARHFSSGNASRYGVFGLLYGLHGTYWDAALAEQRGSLLIEQALAHGYRFAVHGSSSLVHPEFDRTAFAPIRDRIQAPHPDLEPWERDREITDRFLALLDEDSEQPFFGFLFYDSPHSMDYPGTRTGPHAPARRWGNHLELGPDTDPAPLRNRHRNSVHYVDQLVGEVLTALRSHHLMERTAIIVTGDHGEEFNENGQNYWGHNGNYSQYQTQVALLLRIPGRPAGRVDTMTSHVDVAPTLFAEVFRCSTPSAQISNGRSLFSTEPRRHVVVSGGSRGIGIVEPDRITSLERYGALRVLTPRLIEIEEAPDVALVRQVLDESARFHRRDAAPPSRARP